MLLTAEAVELLNETRPEEASLFEAVMRLCTDSQLEDFALKLAYSRKHCEMLRTLFPNDIMAQHGFPALAGWLASRNLASPPATRRTLREVFGRATRTSPSALPSRHDQTLAPALDRLSSLGTDGRYVSLPHSCTVLARRTVTPTKDFCVIATAWNEGVYILDWLAHHFAIGAQAVFLYTNDNDDGSDKLLAALAGGGAIHWTRNQLDVGSTAQPKAYGHALGIRPKTLDYRWALIADLDEYLVIDPAMFPSAIEFLAWHERRTCDAIALNWVVHGSAGVPRWADDFIARRFPYSLGGAGPHVKTMFRPKRFIHSPPHYPTTMMNSPFVFRAEDGTMHRALNAENGYALSANPNAKYAWINHYFYKSSEDFLVKWSRNRGDSPMIRQATASVLTADFIRSFTEQFLQRYTPKVSIGQGIPRFATELDRSMRLPGVSSAATRVKALFQERIRTIVPLFRDADCFHEAGAAGAAFLSALERR